MKQLLLAVLFALTSVITAQAADPVEHVVERGETLASIAKHYNITEKSLLEANPDTAGYVYAGMVLTIPADSEAYSHSEISHFSPSDVSSSDVATQHGEDSRGFSEASSVRISRSKEENITRGPSPSDFSNLGVTYFADFRDFAHGFYGLVADVYYDSGFGFMLELKANYGIVKPGSLNFYFGPQFGYSINEYFMPAVKLKGFMGYQDIVVGHTYGYLHSGPYDKDKTSLELGGGILFSPTLNFKFGRIVLGIGYDLGFYSIRGAIKNYDDYLYYAPTRYSNSYGYGLETEEYNRKQLTSFFHGFEIQLGFHF